MNQKFPQGDPPQGDSPQGDPPQGDPPQGDPLQGDPSQVDPPQEDPPQEDPGEAFDDSLDETVVEAPIESTDNELPRVDVADVILRRGRNLLLSKMFGGDDDETELNRLGRYVIQEQLGQGGMGVVYKAHDPELNRAVAIKLIKEITKDDAKMRDRFRREAQAIAKVKHPNVIEVYDTGIDESGHPFIVMEYVQGQNLKQWLHQSPRDIHEIFKTFAAAAKGLGVVHEKGIVHHDFKPENVLIDKLGRVRVADFGLAKASDDMYGVLDSHHHNDAFRYDITQTGALIGTVPYMAPELLTGSDARGDTRTDQFAFCVSLYEALAGIRPFQGDDSHAIRQAIQRGRVKPLPRSKKVPRRIEAAIRKGLSVSPDDRHESMKDLATLLARASKRPKRLRWLAWGGGLLTVVLAILGAWGVFKIMQRQAPAIEDFELMDVPEPASMASGTPFLAYETRKRFWPGLEWTVAPPTGEETVPDVPTGVSSSGASNDSQGTTPGGTPETEPPPDAAVPPASEPNKRPGKTKKKGDKPTPPPLVEFKLRAGDFDTTEFDFGRYGGRTISTPGAIELPATRITVQCREYDANRPREWWDQILDLEGDKRTIKCVKGVGPRLQ